MRKILTIVAVVLLTILSVSVVSLAFIRSDFNQISLSNIEYIKISSNGESMTIMHDTENKEHKEIYNKVLELYKQSTKDVILSGLFGGAYTEKAKPTISGPTAAPGEGSQMFVEIAYKSDNMPTIMLNGKVYVSPNNATDIKYEKAKIMINNTQTLTTSVTHLLLPLEGNNSYRNSYKLESISKQDKLANYINELSEEGIWLKK